MGGSYWLYSMNYTKNIRLYLKTPLAAYESNEKLVGTNKLKKHCL